VSTVEEISFDERGLIPVIAQDAATNAVLTLAYASREAVEKTLASGEAHYYSRSRGELWRKGASSGNTQKVVEIRLDCDGDALLYRVEPRGPACHTGEESCFSTTVSGEAVRVAPQYSVPDATFTAEAGAATENPEPNATPASERVAWGDTEADFGSTVKRLTGTIAQRHREMPEGSYTAELLGCGTERLAQKVGEEAVEVVVAALTNERLAEEAADLVYHLLVLLEERGVGSEEVARVLEDRHG
jgi:phosphoribosyl-AMP cyclohydrolase / phosphoribosyl-ATP pyrophosphohydrolase